VGAACVVEGAAVVSWVVLGAAVVVDDAAVVGASVVAVVVGEVIVD
jgi:hypothetical protein